MLVGPREILESYYGTTRRRKLNDNENVFGMPVMQSGNVLAAPTGGTNGEAQLSTPVAGEV